MARRDRQLHKHVLCRTAMPRPIAMLGGEASKGAPRTVNSLDTTIASLVTTNGAFTRREFCVDPHRANANVGRRIVGDIRPPFPILADSSLFVRTRAPP